MHPAFVSYCLAHIRGANSPSRCDPRRPRLIPADTLKLPEFPSRPAGSASPHWSLQKQPPGSGFIFKKEKKKKVSFGKRCLQNRASRCWCFISILSFCFFSFFKILPFIPILLRGSDDVGQGTTRRDATPCTLLHL